MSFFAPLCAQGCQMVKFDPFHFLGLRQGGGVGAQSKERRRSNFEVFQNEAIVLQALGAKYILPKNLAIAIWQPCLRSLCHLHANLPKWSNLRPLLQPRKCAPISVGPRRERSNMHNNCSCYQLLVTANSYL